jgi:dienelactone hydrolase
MMRMAMALLLMWLSSGVALAAVKGEEVQYKAGDTVLKGYLAWDDAQKGKRPGVLVVHEWWGHNEYARERARMLAGLGYTALAVDMYGDGKLAAHPQDAGKFSGEVRKNLPVAKARFDAARQLLAKHASVDSKQIAAIGYCFGGAIVLEMARLGESLKGVVSFHGPLGTEQPAKTGKVKARVLVLTGSDDAFIPAEQVDAFKKEMQAAKVNYRLISYPGARHAFTVKEADEISKKFNMPALAYNAEADQKSWAEMQAFLKEILAKK